MSMELRNVENYVEIAKARFVEAIHMTLDIDPNALDSVLPPLIIQPIVENAIRHGGVAVDNRVVNLEISRIDSMITITVTDKGHGFPDEILADLDDHKCKKYSGMFNVHKRMVSIYGWDSRLRVDSAANGSTVSFTIPANPITIVDGTYTSKNGGKCFANSRI